MTPPPPTDLYGLYNAEKITAIWNSSQNLLRTRLFAQRQLPWWFNQDHNSREQRTGLFLSLLDHFYTQTFPLMFGHFKKLITEAACCCVSSSTSVLLFTKHVCRCCDSFPPSQNRNLWFRHRREVQDWILNLRYGVLQIQRSVQVQREINAEWRLFYLRSNHQINCFCLYINLPELLWWKLMLSFKNGQS